MFDVEIIIMITMCNLMDQFPNLILKSDIQNLIEFSPWLAEIVHFKVL